VITLNDYKCNCVRCPQCSSSFVNIVIGIGLGILLSRPLAADHPVRWGISILIAGLIGYAYCVYLSKQQRPEEHEMKKETEKTPGNGGE